MREVSIHKKEKVIRLFLDGLAYDEITQQTGISKGSVVNIISAFREGLLPLPPGLTEYVDALRQLAVDLRKSNTNVSHAISFNKIYTKLREMGVPREHIEEWLDTCREIATSSSSSQEFVTAALELSRLTSDNSLTYSELNSQYRLKLNSIKELDGQIEQKQNELNRIRQDKEKASAELNSTQKTIATAKENFHTQKAELESRQEKYLKEHKLSWKKVKLVESLLNTELSATGLKGEQIKRLRGQITATGSLITVMTQLRQRKKDLQPKIETLSDYIQHYTQEIGKLAHNRDQLEVVIHNEKKERGTLETELQAKRSELAEVERETTDKTENLYVSHLIIDFLLNPACITSYDLDRLVEMMITLRQKRLGTESEKVIDANGKGVCRCQVPGMSTDIKAYEIGVDHARETFALLISPLVRDKMVSRFEYNLAEVKHETSEKVAVTKATLEATIQERNRHLI